MLTVLPCPRAEGGHAVASQMIKEQTLRELVASGSVCSSVAIGCSGGFTFSVRCGDAWRVLGSTRGTVRIFANLTSMAIYLRGLGVARFEVDSAHYAVARTRPARPDRAEALRGTRSKPHQPDLLR